MQRVPLITDCITPRFRYLVDFIQSSYRDLILDLSLSPTEEPAIWYGIKPPEGVKGIYIPSSGIMREGARISTTEFSRSGAGHPVLFPFEGQGLGFDLPGAVFWMLSRMEEYGYPDTDRHGRFPLSASAAGRAGVHRIPVCDLWLSILEERLQQDLNVYPTRINSKSPVTLGIDIDFAWKYKHKPWYRSAAGLIKDLFSARLHAVKTRISVLLGLMQDPYDQYARIIQMTQGRAELKFFILAGGHSRYDRNHPIGGRAFRDLLSGALAGQEIGIHPSYSSFQDPDAVDREVKSLQLATGKKTNRSRFHFLRLSIPGSYRQLIRSGISEDYSLGFAEDLGFRAGTCRPFFWYDLDAETTTGLKVHPFMAMDRTLKDYLKLSPESACREIGSLLEVCRQYGGQAHLIWHNSSFDPDGGWKGWDRVPEAFLDHSGNPGTGNSNREPGIQAL